MEQIILDASRMPDPGIAHEYLKEKFRFPKHYGYNLDALHDCLSEITEETEILLIGFDTDMVYPQKVLRVLQDVQAENDNFLLISK